MTDAPGRRVELLDLPITADLERVRMTLVELPPGGAAGRHRHPCDVVGLIRSGAVHYAREGTDAVLLGAGDAFHEPSGAVVTRFDNASTTQPAVFVAVYLQPDAEAPVIEMLSG